MIPNKNTLFFLIFRPLCTKASNNTTAESSEDELNGYDKVVVSQNLAEEILDKEIEEGTGEPVDLFVDQKTKNKILSHEAVDFSLLINKKQN